MFLNVMYTFCHSIEHVMQV